MNNTVVVEDKALSFFLAKLHDIFIVIQHLSKTAEGWIIIVQKFLRNIKDIGKVSGHGKSGYFAMAIELNHSLSRPHVETLMFEVKWYVCL